jgi:hypothetical protein
MRKVSVLNEFGTRRLYILFYSTAITELFLKQKMHARHIPINADLPFIKPWFNILSLLHELSDW